MEGAECVNGINHAISIPAQMRGAKTANFASIHDHLHGAHICGCIPAAGMAASSTEGGGGRCAPVIGT
eukprot:1160430-Pelagomonas_calceolata.AAC.5